MLLVFGINMLHFGWCLRRLAASRLRIGLKLRISQETHSA